METNYSFCEGEIKLTNIKKMVLIILVVIILVIFTGDNILIGLDHSSNINGEQEIDFVDANLRDIIYTFAAVYDLNVYVFENVTGRASIKLQGKEGVEVLENLIINSGYSWQEKNNVIYIGSEDESREIKPENIFSREDWTFETLNFPEEWEEDWNVMLDRFYPDVMRIVNKQDKILVIAGQEETVTRKKELIEAIFPVDKEKRTYNYKEKTEIISVPKDDNLEFNFLEIFSDISFRDFSDSGFVFLSGQEKQVIASMKAIEDYIERFVLKEKIITLNYISAENVIENLELFDSMVKMNALNESRLIIKGNNRDIKRAENKIAELDRPLQQVMIELEVLEFSRDELEQSFIMVPPEIGIAKENLDSFEFNLAWDQFIKNAREKGEMELLASARLSALAGKPARIHIGESFPLAIEVDGEEQLEYLDAGIILEVLTKINDREEIELYVEPEISTAEMTAGGFPSFNTRKLESSIRLNDGETFLLGGITRDQTQLTGEKTPFLSSIPLLGNLFSGEYFSKESSELIISVTPHLLKDEEAELQENYKEERIY